MKIFDLQKSMVDMNPKFREVEENLKNPYRLKNVHLITHNILKNNLEILNELKKMSEELLRDTQELKK